MTGFLLNWVATAVLLIAAVLLLRAVFGKRISARLRYALWLLVLVRLLVPVQMFTAPVETPQVLPELRAAQALPSGTAPADKGEPIPKADAAPPAQAIPAPDGEEAAPPAPEAGEPLDPLALLGWTWLAGTVLAALALVWSNLRFAARLRRVRVPLEGTGRFLRVYTAPGLPSPCLFGVLRPAVYVTPEAAADPVCLRHVLAHETTHFRHGDHIWSLLRCAALAVHWWDPLVWLAAVLSRRDAELACDEGALKALGDGERWAYGNTLLALVTAKPQPGDLLRCATTMAGDARSLRERIGRIAHAPKRWLWAAVLAVALSGLVCACAFAKTEKPQEDRPLTQEELDYYNSEVFNGMGFNILNQFVYLAVEAPKDYKQIDLFSVFYNGTGEPGGVGEEERRAVAEAGYGGEDPGVDLIKCPASQMDEILQRYLGLGLEETDKWGLGNFTYLEEYDAYYDFHGDTNYLPNVTFTSGEYKDGNILLYYEGNGYPVLSDPDGLVVYWDGFKQVCLTLEPQKDGGFHFLSNWECDPPAHPTAYPAWEPERIVPLDGLEPYRPPELEMVLRTGGVEETLWSTRFEPDESSSDGFDVEIARSFEGDLLLSVVASEAVRDCFLTVPADDSAGWTPDGHGVELFTDLFGCYGMAVRYFGQRADRSYGPISDYYIFSDNGTPSLLLRAKGIAEAVDLDGDGVDELAATSGEGAQIFFLRDRRLYEADVDALLHAAWPEAGYMTYGWLDTAARCLHVSAEVPLPNTDLTATGYRTLWFDGENLRLYKDESRYPDHVKDGIDAPADVLAAAREFVESRFQALAEEGHSNDGPGDFGDAVWDDWRIIDLQGPSYETAGPLRMEIWNLSYETHTTTPDRPVLAGGSYMGEDGWAMIGYPGCDYLYFRLDEDDRRTYMFSKMENDCFPGSAVFLSDMVDTLMDQGLLKLSDLSGEELAKVMAPQSARAFNDLAEGDASERDAVLETLGEYMAMTAEGRRAYESFADELDDGGYRAEELTDEGWVAWTTLKGIITGMDRRWGQAAADEVGQITAMPLPELLEYAGTSDGAYAESAFTQLHQRLLGDPAAVLTALAEREDRDMLADLLAWTICRDEDVFPGAVEQIRALEGLDGEQSAVRERIVSTYEARKQEDAA